MNVVEIAKSVGADLNDWSKTVDFDPADLQAFADAITKEKDTEIEQLNTINKTNGEVEKIQNRVIDSLNAKVAMLKNMFESVWVVIPKETFFSKETIESVEAKLSATEQDVTRWVNGVKADALEEMANVFSKHINYWGSPSETTSDVVKERLLNRAEQLRGEK